MCISAASRRMQVYAPSPSSYQADVDALRMARTPPPRTRLIRLDTRILRSGGNQTHSSSSTGPPQGYHFGTARPAIVHTGPIYCRNAPTPSPRSPRHAVSKPSSQPVFLLQAPTGATLSQARLNALPVHGRGPRRPRRPPVNPQPSLSTRQTVRSVQPHGKLPGLSHGGSRLLQQPPVDFALLLRHEHVVDLMTRVNGAAHTCTA